MKPDSLNFNLPGSIAPALWFAGVAVVLFVTISSFAPNYQTTQPTRQHPLGGDFLQEWVGGHLVITGRHDELYRGGRFRATQHDQRLTGFHWPEERYFPAVYPPFYYLLCSPLACLPYATAAKVWLALMVAALFAALWLARSLAHHRSWVLGFCLCYPVMLSLTSGQKGTLLLLILVATFWLLKHDKPFSAGLVFALIAFKPHLAIPFGLVMLIQRQWRFLGGCLVALTVLIGTCAAMGWGVCHDYLRVCMQMGNYVNTGGYHLGQGFSLWSAAQLALSSTSINSAALAKLAAGGGCLAILAALLILFRDRFEPHSQRGTLQFSAAVVATVLLSPHFYAYDLSILIIVATLVILAIQGDGRRPVHLILLASLVAILLLTHSLIWIASHTGISIGVMLTCLAFGILAFLSSHPSARRVERVGPSASSCDIAGFVSGH